MFSMTTGSVRKSMKARSARNSMIAGSLRNSMVAVSLRKWSLAAALGLAAAPASAISFNFVEMWQLPKPDGTVGGRVDALALLADGSAAMAGRCADAAGIEHPVLWTDAQQPPIELPTLGFGGVARSVVYHGVSGNDVLIVGGSAFASDGQGVGVVWLVDDAGAEMHQLVQGNYIGTDVRSVGLLEEEGIYFAVGRVETRNGRQLAAVWSGSNSAEMELEVLPGTPAGGNSSATGYLDLKLKDVLVSSIVTPAGGEPQAAYWVRSDNAWSGPLALPDLGGGSSAFGIAQGVRNAVLAGEVENANSEMTPAFWFNGGAVLSTPSLPGGYDGGRVNGIIAILIGLVVAGGDVTADGISSAALFTGQPGRPGSVLDLNDVAWNEAADGLHLSSTRAGVAITAADSITLTTGGAALDGDGIEQPWAGVIRALPSEVGEVEGPTRKP